MSQEQSETNTVYKCPHCLNVTIKKDNSFVYCAFDDCGFMGTEDEFEIVEPLPEEPENKEAIEMFNKAADKVASQERKVAPKGTVFFYAGDAMDAIDKNGEVKSRVIFSGLFSIDNDIEIGDVYNHVIYEKKIELGTDKVFLKSFNVVGA